MNLRKTIQRIIRKETKKKINEPLQHSVSITSMCKTVGHPEYFEQIRNRIFREMEQDKTVGDYVYMDGDMKDIFLGADGVCYLSDLLMGYFKEKDIVGLHQYMVDLDTEEKIKFQFVNSLKITSTPDIKEFLSVIDGWNCETDTEQFVRNFADDELDSRKGFRGFMRSLRLFAGHLKEACA